MALVALAANRSPGCTTLALALALAALWPPPRQALVIEADPDGGTVAARQVLPHEPGLLGLAAAGSSGVTVDDVYACVQVLPGGTPAVLAPPGPDRATAALVTLTDVGLPALLRRVPSLDVLTDVGRLDARSPARAFADDADALVFVVRATVEDVVGLQHRLETLPIPRSRCSVVVVGHAPYRPVDIAEALDLPLLGEVPVDARAAGTVADGGRPPRGRFQQGVVTVADELVRRLPDPPPAVAPTAGSRPAPPSAVPPSTGFPR